MGEFDRWDVSPTTGRPAGTAHASVKCTALLWVYLQRAVPFPLVRGTVEGLL